MNATDASRGHPWSLGPQRSGFYHRVVSTLGVALLGAVVGVVVGVVLARLLTRQPEPPAEPVPPDPMEEIRPILSVLRSGAVLLDNELTVLQANPAAYAYGIVRGGQLARPDLVRLVEDTNADGLVHELAITTGPEHRGDRAVSLAVRASRLPDGRVLVQALDRSGADRTEETRRDFVANVSHELKTPVGAISLLAEAVADAADDPEAVTRFAASLQRESTRLGKIVTELIELSRLQLDNPVEAAQSVGVDQVIAEALDRCRAAAELKQIRLVRGGPAGLRIVGDKTMLVTALVNLVENGVAYSPEATRVAVGVRPRDDMVEITVTDQGIGIPADEVDRIFERFYRIDPARSRQTGGTGLGLSIVKHIVAAHRGEISVWSSPGAGSTFTVRLPRHPAEDEPDPRPPVPAETATTEGLT